VFFLSRRLRGQPKVPRSGNVAEGWKGGFGGQSIDQFLFRQTTSPDYPQNLGNDKGMPERVIERSEIG
jgi:hypothetical protein